MRSQDHHPQPVKWASPSVWKYPFSSLFILSALTTCYIKHQTDPWELVCTGAMRIADTAYSSLHQLDAAKGRTWSLTTLNVFLDAIIHSYECDRITVCH